jgi:dynein heavy chain
MLYAKPDAVKNLNDLIRLYLHESQRVYCDKLVDKDDIELFYKIQKDIMKKSFEVKMILY